MRGGGKTMIGVPVDICWHYHSTQNETHHAVDIVNEN